MAQIYYRVRVATRGASAVTGNVDFTLQAEVAEAPTILGQMVDPLRGRTQSRPWSVAVVDSAEVLTAELADANGRMHLLGRLVDLQTSPDNSAWTTVATGRWSDLTEMDGPGLYRLQVEDERWIERNTTIFETADTTQVYPLGLRYAYRDYPVAGTVELTVAAVRNNLVLLRDDRGSDDPFIPLSDPIRDLIRDDLKAETSPLTTVTEGNFDTLRANVDGTEREISSFGIAPTTTAGTLNPSSKYTWEIESSGIVYYVWVVWPTSQPSVGDTVDVSLAMVTHQPTPALPLHVGVADAAHDFGTSEGGIHPFDLLKRLYDEAGVRYDSTQMAAMAADGRYPRMALRITEPKNLARWAEDHIFGPLMVVPFIGADGEVVPKPVHLPEDLDPDTLPTLTSANQSEHPTFQHSRREVVNAIRFRYVSEVRISDDDMEDDPPRDLAADRIRANEHEEPRDHDNQTELGVNPVSFDLEGYHDQAGTFSYAGQSIALGHRSRIMGYLASEVFDRFGDGPIRGRIVGLSDVADVEAGDLVVMALDSFPNPALNARGGERILQILAKDITPAGPEFEFLDIGPKSQPIAGPTVAIAQNASRPEHDVDVTISNIPAGASAQLQLAYSATEPAYSSDLWAAAGSDLGNETVTIADNPTGATVWARARTTAPGRIRSAWSTPVSVALDSAPYVRSVRVTFDANGLPTVTWEESTAAAGVRIYYRVHNSDTAAGTLTSYVDADGSAGSKTLPVTVAEGQQVTIEVEPWTGWTGAAVSGTAGERVGYSAARVYTPTPPNLLVLKNFRETELDNGSVRLDWEEGAGVDSVAIYLKTITLPLTADPWPTDEANRLPDVILPAGTLTYTVDAPGEGQKTYGQAEPWDDQVPPNVGRVERFTVEGVPVSVQPRIEYIGQAPASGNNKTDVVAVVADPSQRAGRLYAWLNAGSTDEADPTGPADGYIDIDTAGDGVASVTAADTWTLTGGGTAQLFDELDLHAGYGKRIWLQFDAEDGETTGQVDKLLRTWYSVLVGATGAWVDEIVTEAAIAQRAIGTDRLKLAGVERGNIVDAAINAAKIGDSILDLTEFSRVVVDGSIVATKLSISELSEIADDVGIVVSGELRNALGTRYINLDATGTQSFIEHDAFNIKADGSANFGGTITSLATLTGRIVVAGNLDNGAVDITAVIADGVITAPKLQISELSSITSDIGIILNGVMRNSGNTAGIRVDSTDTLPGAWVAYLDLGASGANAVLKTPQVSINYDGSGSLGSGMTWTNTGDITFSGTVASETFTATTATFSGSVRAGTGDPHSILSNTTLSFADASGNFDAEVGLASGNLVLQTTGDLHFSPTASGYVDFRYSWDTTARSSAGSYLPVRINGTLRYIELFS